MSSEPSDDEGPVRELRVPVLDAVVLQRALRVLESLARVGEPLQSREHAARVRDDAAEFAGAALGRHFDPERTAVFLVRVEIAHDEKSKDGRRGIAFREGRGGGPGGGGADGNAGGVRGDAVGVRLDGRGLVDGLPVGKDAAVGRVLGLVPSRKRGGGRVKNVWSKVASVFVKGLLFARGDASRASRGAGRAARRGVGPGAGGSRLGVVHRRGTHFSSSV